VIDGSGATKMFAAIVLNQDNLSGSLDQFAVTVDEIEQRTGLDFFSELEDPLENELESHGESLPYSAAPVLKPISKCLEIHWPESARQPAPAHPRCRAGPGARVSACGGLRPRPPIRRPRISVCGGGSSAGLTGRL
jgi:hypothetical protein